MDSVNAWYEMHFSSLSSVHCTNCIKKATATTTKTERKAYKKLLKSGYLHGITYMLLYFMYRIECLCVCACLFYCVKHVVYFQLFHVNFLSTDCDVITSSIVGKYARTHTRARARDMRFVCWIPFACMCVYFIAGSFFAHSSAQSYCKNMKARIWRV